MSLLQETISKILPPNEEAGKIVAEKLQNIFGSKHKKLGELENLLLKYVKITGEISPQIPKKCTIITCGDHGVAEMNISAYPQETTTHMTRNYVESKGAVANAMSNFCKSDMVVVDMGIVTPVEEGFGILNRRLGYGTKNFTKGPAMTKEDAQKAIETGIALVEEKVKEGYRCFLPGEMGIANTSSSAAMIATLCDLTPEEATGRGTNISDDRLKVKIDVVRKGIEVNKPDKNDGLDVMAKLGGFELACITGIILGAAANKSFVVLDGFNTGAAALVANAIAPNCKDYLMASHLAAEPAHGAILKKLNLHPYMDLRFRLGEATGSSIAVNILDCAISIYNALEKGNTNGEFKVEIPHFNKITGIVYDSHLPKFPKPDLDIKKKCRYRIDNLTKPIYSLGRLEDLAEKIASIKKEIKPTMVNKEILVISSTGKISEIDYNFIKSLSYHASSSFHIIKRGEDAESKTVEDFLNDGYSYGKTISDVNVLGISFLNLDMEDKFIKYLKYAYENYVKKDREYTISLEEFMALKTTEGVKDFAFCVGTILGAISKGILVLSDDYFSIMALKYAIRISESAKDYILFLKPDYLDLDLDINGGVISALGMKLIDAGLQMMKDMKTFAEAKVAIATDGPGKGIQVDK